MKKPAAYRPPMFTDELGHGIEGTPEGVAEDAARQERRARLAAKIKVDTSKNAASKKSNYMKM